MTLNGMFSEPKPHRINFIKENKRKLKQISSLANQSIRSTGVDMAKLQSSQTDVGRQALETSSRVNAKHASSCKLNRKSTITVFIQDKKNDDEGSTTALLTSQRTSNKNLSLVRNQFCQTIDPKNYDELFHEGTIMYPSKNVLEEIAAVEREKANRLDAHVKKDFFKKNKIKSKSSSKFAGKTNFIEMTKQSQDMAKSNDEENKIPNICTPIKKKESESKANIKSKVKETAPLFNAAEIIRKTTEDHYNYRPQSYQANQGTMRAVPLNRGDSNLNHTPKIMSKSLVRKNKKDEDEVLKAVLDPLCPPGHIPLPDQDRRKTLHMLRVSHAELIREMNLLPVRTDTLRVRQRKIQLENELNKIEEGIKVFNKSKVYVKIEE